MLLLQQCVQLAIARHDSVGVQQSSKQMLLYSHEPTGIDVFHKARGSRVQSAISSRQVARCISLKKQVLNI